MNKTKLVYEIGINHNGDINMIKQMIDIAKLGECDYIKFQKRCVNLVYSKEELDKPRESPWGSTNRDQKYGLELGNKEYDIIDRYCKEKEIGWFASPWDVHSVNFLMEYDIPYIKIASACITDKELLEKVKETNKPVIISTGMSTEKEIDECLNILEDRVEYILSCTSTYPTKDEDMNMLKIKTLKDKYGDKYKIGFSNHSPGIQYIFMSYVMGVEMIEFHGTLDRTLYGSDQASSLESGAVLKIKSWLNCYGKCWGTGDLGCLENEKPIRKKLRK